MSNRSKRAKQFAVLGGGALVAAPMFGIDVADAATYQVTNLLDSGDGSLRKAIELANGDAAADVITFAPGLTGTITLTTGDLRINTPMTITGPGSSSITVDGDDVSRVLYIYAEDNIDVTVSGLTLADGNSSNLNGGAVWAGNTDLTLDAVKVLDSNAGGAYGGGVYIEGDGSLAMLGSRVSGTLTSEVSGNTANYGGGIYIAGASSAVIIRDTLISGNTAGAWGGGLYFDDGVSLELTRDVITDNDADGAAGASIGVVLEASVTITDCTISDNVATGKSAGGIGLESPMGLVTISGTTFSGNSSTNEGGGLYLNTINADLSIVNSTFSGNSAGTDGGGIYFKSAPYGVVTFAHTTITGNTATSDGGGVAFYAGTDPLMLDHTVVAGNSAGDEGNDINTYEGAFEGDYSMIGDLDHMTLDGTTNLPEGDAMLGALADHGGYTLTHLPLDGSPLLNSGDPAFSAPPATDQRGLSRVYAGRIDVGAVEAQPELPPTGSSSGLLASIGAALLALGGAMHLTDRRRTRRV